MDLRAWQKLSLAYFGLLGLFLAGMIAGGLSGLISDTGSGLLGSFGLIGFFVLGLPLAYGLAKALGVEHGPGTWAAAYVGLTVFTGAGGLVLLGVLSYKAFKKMDEGKNDGL